MGINKGRIPHYFQFIQHQFWVFFLSQPCFIHISLLQYCLLDSYLAHVMFLFLFLLFHNLDVKLNMLVFSSWFRKFSRLGCFYVRVFTFPRFLPNCYHILDYEP
jgi:hypothetical protein